MHGPLVVLMALPSEQKTSWFPETISSLVEHQYDYIVMESTSKFSAIRGANATETIRAMGLKIRQPNEGQRGCWVSHLRAWALQHTLSRPIISLEADTKAIVPWDVKLSPDWEEYDFLFAHDHAQRKKHCTHTSKVLRGLESRYATGAMLYTGRTPLPDVVSLIDTALPIGHWFNLMDREKKLKIGSLCPSLFTQRTDKGSEIQVDGKY